MLRDRWHREFETDDWGSIVDKGIGHTNVSSIPRAFPGQIAAFYWLKRSRSAGPFQLTRRAGASFRQDQRRSARTYQENRRSRSFVRYVQDVSARLAMNGVGVMALKAAEQGCGHQCRSKSQIASAFADDVGRSLSGKSLFSLHRICAAGGLGLRRRTIHRPPAGSRR
jgi:hypothetical protein